MAAPRLCALLGHLEKLSRGPRQAQRTDRELLEDFAARQDETAFAELVARHGPLVLRVCRRVLHHEQDAEDVFQATFLVLARSVGSIRKQQSLSSWLYGVAYRTSMNAKRSATRRRHHEARSQESKPAAAPSPNWDDVQTILDEEIHRLPATFRAAFVLGVLEGKTLAEMAAELHCKEGTVSSRLTRARQRLQQQLLRRGIRLPALLAALSIAESTKATVPAGLAEVTVRIGLLGTAGGSAVGEVPPLVAALAAGVARTLFLQKARFTTVVLFSLGLAAASAGVFLHQALAAWEQPVASPQAESSARVPPPGVPAPKPAAAESQDSIAYGGRVLGPGGQPVMGAQLYLTGASGGYGEGRSTPAPVVATSGPEGRFEFQVPKTQLGQDWACVAATAANHGAGWVVVPADGRRDGLTIHLVQDDVPITGQILNLEGKPVVGATLRVLQINAARGEDLGPWLEAVRGKKGLSLDLEQKYVPRYTLALSPQAVTDTAGRFRLTGIGCNRLVRARLEGPGIASEKLYLLTRPGKAITVPYHEGNPESNDPRSVIVYYAANFQHVAVPTRPVIGVVRDRDTGKPLAGVKIRSDSRASTSNQYRRLDTEVWTSTDAKGRYRLVGLAKGTGYMMVVVPAGDQPYVATRKPVPDSPGLDPVTVDVELKRGVWIEGKLTDKATGQPLQGAVEYFSMYTNPNLRDYPGLDFANYNIVSSKADGTYRVAGLPGPGLLGVLYHRVPYLRANEREDEFGTRERSFNTTPYAILFPSNYNALARIDPPGGAEVVKCDITIDPGWSSRVLVQGPDNNPLAGVRCFGLTGWSWESQGGKTGEFTLWFNPYHPHDVLLQHPEKRLVGVVRPPKENGGTVTVRMELGAVITGRLVDADGKPRTDVELGVTFHPWKKSADHPYSPNRIQTDREGRFRVEAVLPGCSYRLKDEQGEVIIESELRSGQTKDLGDVRMNPGEE